MRLVYFDLFPPSISRLHVQLRYFGQAPACRQTYPRPPVRHVARGIRFAAAIARQRFAKQGYAATSVREIAGLAGVDPALMAHHFGSKEGLWIAVVDQLAAQLAELIEMTTQLRNSRMSPIERIRQALTLFIDNVFANPDIGMFFSTATTEHGERLNVLVERLLGPYRDAFIPLLADAIEAGKMKSHDPELMHAMIVNAISNTISYGHVFAKFSTLPDHPEKFKQGVLDIVMGLLR
ncbi:TetR/AcrR family transcriptional regulator [Burkholderia sp. LMG 13014]|uniref:TetR/AcrR family transcriptional regulator n=1 Tax=Burkholderia sp. LMG 13014 TaxID=2709306 RepID=UPI0027DDDC3A|nr:TetR/AcrR family transcriptional regulator [Burkholderia sp. LMG 13014]